MVHALNGAREQMERALAEAGIDKPPANASHLHQAYLELLLRWNQRLNLTGVREPEQIIRRHFVESAFAAQHLPGGISSLLDYGSGAGFPGIPIAILRPEIRVTLAEAQGKKASFLREALRVLSIFGEVHDGRVETMPGDRRFDAVTMRAVEKMELAVPVAAKHVERYLALLVTAQTAPRFRQLAPDLRWLEPLPLPNTEQMVLAFGQRRA